MARTTTTRYCEEHGDYVLFYIDKIFYKAKKLKIYTCSICGFRFIQEGM